MAPREDRAPLDHFELISEKDSKSIFKPNVPTLVLSQSAEMGPNIMTAAWWMVGGYAPFRYLLAINHKTFTHDIVQENPEFVLAAPTPDMVDAVTLCGYVSGRDIDKIEYLDLDTVPAASVEVPLLKNAVGNVECRVVDSFEFAETTYYVASVEGAYVKPDVLNGRIPSPSHGPLAYLGSDWESKDDEYKNRYYAEIDEEDVHAFPGEEILGALPDDRGEKS